MATSIKNVENPVTVISFNFLRSPSGFTSRRVFFLHKEMGQHSQKTDSRSDGRSQSRSIGAHITGKYKEIIPENIEIPPARTPPVARTGSCHSLNKPPASG